MQSAVEVPNQVAERMSWQDWLSELPVVGDVVDLL